MPKRLAGLRQPLVEQLEGRMVLSALNGLNPDELVDTSLTPEQLATSLVGAGVEVSNVTFTGGNASTGSFDFAVGTVVGFQQGIILSSGRAVDVVGPNDSDWTSTDFAAAGDADLDALSGFPTYDAAVLEFDFVPTANQVVFLYAFGSDEYPEWVNTPYNDVFAFYVNGTNYADVRQIAGDPTAAFVPVAVNNINDGNALYPDFTPMRPDLFRTNYYNPSGPSAIDLELDGITNVLTFQAPVIPGVVNHMKLAVADASDGIYDSAVFIQAGSLVSNDNPVADLSLAPSFGDAPLVVTAIVEGEDPSGLPLTYSIDWGDGSVSTGSLDEPTDDSEKTALVDHIYTAGGEYFVTLTVSNGSLSGTSVEDVDVFGGVVMAPDTTITSHPADLSNSSVASFTFDSSKASSTFEYSLDGSPFAPVVSGAVFDSLADGLHTFEVRAVDSAGNADPSPASHTWTIDTLAPETTITAQPDALSNNTSPSFSFDSSEPGATFEYSLDGGALTAATSGITLGPLADGTHTFEVRATDAAGNIDPTPASYTWTISTAPAPASAAIVADPENPGQFMLSVVGTGQDDTIAIAPSQGKIRVTLAGTTLGVFSAAEFQRTVAAGLDGNDMITVSAKVVKPAELHGGAGNDVLVGGPLGDVLLGEDGNDRLHGNAGHDALFGGAGDDILFGSGGNDTLNSGTGNDVLSGGAGDDALLAGGARSLLIGGSGWDTLTGGMDEDILIGGSTKYDANAAALTSLLAEWRRTDLTYQQRIDHLTGKVNGGLNGTAFLKAKTVSDDGITDSLSGLDGQDWFWGLAAEVADLQADERLN